MSLFSGISNAVSTVLSPAGAVLSGVGNSLGDFKYSLPFGIGQGYTNQENLAYQKYYNSMIMSREDNAVQRREADLLAAGLSPTLAAGSAAGVGGSMSAPQRGSTPDIVGQAAGVMSLLKMKQDIATSLAQRDLIAAQTVNAESNADVANATAATKWHDYEIFNKTGTTSNMTGLGNDLRNIGSFLDSPIMKSAKDEIKDKWERGKVLKQKIDKAVETPIKNLFKPGPEKNMFNSDDYK